jgi:hypothetical protein
VLSKFWSVHYTGVRLTDISHAGRMEIAGTGIGESKTLNFLYE